MWTSHQNPENGLTYYFNSATGISTYTPPPDLAADESTPPPPTPGKQRSNLTRSSSFVKSAAQRKLLASLPESTDPSDDDVDRSGPVNLEPPTSPTRGADRQVAPGWKAGGSKAGGSKANRCTNARHQQALALAAEPSLSMAAAYAQSVVAANAHSLASAQSLALRALEEGKIATPAMVDQVRAVAKGETPLRPHPLSGGAAEHERQQEEDDDDEWGAKEQEVVAAEMQAAVRPPSHHPEMAPVWQQLTANSNGESHGESHGGACYAWHAVDGGGDQADDRGLSAPSSEVRLADPPLRRATAAPLTLSAAAAVVTHQQPVHLRARPSAGHAAVGRGHHAATAAAAHGRPQGLTARPSTAPASSRRPRRGSGVVLARPHATAARLAVLPGIPEAAAEAAPATEAGPCAAEAGPCAADGVPPAAEDFEREVMPVACSIRGRSARGRRPRV